MKIIKNIFLSAVLASLLLTSCADWLGEKPVTNYDIDGISGEDGINSLLTGTYASLKSSYGISHTIGIVGTDICRAGKNNVNTSNLDQYTLNSSLAVVQNAWTDIFKTIQNSNVVIRRATLDETLSDAVRTNFIAQARFIRAFSYFKAVQWFGALPILTDETLNYDEAMLSLPRSEVREVYDLIVSDLLYASTEGILDDKPVDGHVTRYAAKALLGKVYLTMGTSKYRLSFNEELADIPVLKQYENLPETSETYYRMAYNTLLDVIDNGGFALTEQYSQVFSISSDDKFTNGESLWEIAYSSQAGYGSRWSKSFGQWPNGATAYTVNAMGGQCLYKPVPSFWSYYKKGDLRRRYNLTDQMISGLNNNIYGTPYLAAHQIPDETLGYDMNDVYSGNVTGCKVNEQMGIGKYRWTTGDTEEMWKKQMTFSPDNCPNNVIVLRYADVLLMFIEADMLLGGASPADLSSIGASSLAYDIMNNQILFRARGGLTEEQMLQRSTDTWADRYYLNPDGSFVPVADDKKNDYMLDYDPSTNPLTFGELVRERARELCYEFHRWNDLSRWGLLGEMYSSRISSTPNGTVEPYNYLFPIPLREIDATHDKEAFYQNWGY